MFILQYLLQILENSKSILSIEAFRYSKKQCDHKRLVKRCNHTELDRKDPQIFTNCIFISSKHITSIYKDDLLE